LGAFHRTCIECNKEEEEEEPPNPKIREQMQIPDPENLARMAKLRSTVISTLSVGSPLCPYGIAYHRVIATPGGVTLAFLKSRCLPDTHTRRLSHKEESCFVWVWRDTRAGFDISKGERVGKGQGFQRAPTSSTYQLWNLSTLMWGTSRGSPSSGVRWSPEPSALLARSCCVVHHTFHYASWYTTRAFLSLSVIL
jgi:hypothetical protein